ncbi:TPA: glycosyltransferase family 2 protein [bacterium]|nr:glycosyltransferase family 2 protein [bacterium]
MAKETILLLPALNEEGKIGRVVAKTKGFVDEVLVIDDGSTDNTAREAEGEGAKVIKHRVNMGAGAAIRSGMEHALSQGYEIIVIMGGDDQDMANEMPRLIDPIINEGYDFVQGSRRLHGKRTVNMPFFRRITTKVYSLLFRLLTGFPATDGTNGYRAMKSSLFKDKRIDLNQDWLNRYELEPYIFYKVVKLGYRVKEVPVTKIYHQGDVGYTKMVPILDWWSILRPLIYLKFGIKR